MKIKHILDTKEFADIFKNGEKTCGKTVSLYYKETDKAEDLYIGVTVGKKFAEKAVTRNYIKRLIYSYFRTAPRPCRKGLKIVVRITASAKNIKRPSLSRAIREDLEEQTGRAGLNA